MPRLQRPTSAQQLLNPMIWGLGVIALIPLVVLGGLVALLVGTVTTLVRSTRRRRPARQVLSPVPSPVLPRPVLRTPTHELRTVLAGRRAA